LAGDIAEAVDQRHVSLIEIIGRSFDGGIDRGRLALDQSIGKQTLSRVVLEPGIAEHASALGFGDALAVGMQLDIVTNTAAKGARRVLYNRKTHVLSLFTRSCWRPDRAARQTFSLAPGHDSCRGCGVVGSGRFRSTPRAGEHPPRSHWISVLPPAPSQYHPT